MTYAGHHCDAADRPEASHTPDMAALCDNPIEALYREATESYSSGGLPGFQLWLKATTADQARIMTVETLSRVLPMLVKPGNVRLRVYTLLVAIGQMTMTAIKAKEMGATLAAVSKQVLGWLDFLGFKQNGTAKIVEPTHTTTAVNLCNKPLNLLYLEATESYSSGGLPGFQKWLTITTEDQSRILTVKTLSKVLPMLVKPGNVRLRVYAVMFAINSDALNGVWTQTAAAKEMGVTRAAVSKQVQWWLDFLGFRRNAHTKSAEAVESYRTVQRERHWRRQSIGKKGGKK